VFFILALKFDLVPMWAKVVIALVAIILVYLVMWLFIVPRMRNKFKGSASVVARFFYRFLKVFDIKFLNAR
jgi:membrane protein YdbS with pleckstrin-like domain